MKVAIRRMGYSQGVDGQIILRLERSNPREGWGVDAERVAQAEDDGLAWTAFVDADERRLKW